MDLRIEERRVANEAIATLVNIKNTMAEMILKPAGVPEDLFQPLLIQRDPNTNQLLSKRQIAPLILDALEKRSDGKEIIRNLIRITANWNWNNFYLAKDEFLARATVQKAQEILGEVEIDVEREILLQKENEKGKQEEARKQFIKQRELLLKMFDDLSTSTDHQKRGYLLQDLLDRVFRLYDIPILKAFTRNEGGEQIDGAFRLEGWHYLVECRWREKLANIRELDGLKGQIDRSGKQTMGFFLSINGWSENVPPLLKQNPDKSIVLMEGYDLRCVLSGEVDLLDLLLAKVEKLNLESEPYYSVKQYMIDRNMI
jgi:phage anti-repressor protein